MILPLTNQAISKSKLTIRSHHMVLPGFLRSNTRLRRGEFFLAHDVFFTFFKCFHVLINSTHCRLRSLQIFVICKSPYNLPYISTRFNSQRESCQRPRHPIALTQTSRRGSQSHSTCHCTMRCWYQQRPSSSHDRAWYPSLQHTRS